MKFLHKLAFILVIIGGLNWLVMGFAHKDILMGYLHLNSSVSNIIYILVGLSAIYLIFDHKGSCRYCSKGNMPAAM